MFTVRCYAFHPLVLKFVRLWRYTQVVSEVLTCILSMICCQCMNMMLLSNQSSIESKFSVQQFKFPQEDVESHTNLILNKEEGEDPRAKDTVVEIHQEPNAMSTAQTQKDIRAYPVQKHICSMRDLQTTTSFWASNRGDKKIIPAIHSTRKGALKPSSNLYIR